MKGGVEDVHFGDGSREALEPERVADLVDVDRRVELAARAVLPVGVVVLAPGRDGDVSVAVPRESGELDHLADIVFLRWSHVNKRHFGGLLFLVTGGIPYALSRLGI